MASVRETAAMPGDVGLAGQSDMLAVTGQLVFLAEAALQ
jgi:hypothetical protein